MTGTHDYRPPPTSRRRAWTAIAVTLAVAACGAAVATTAKAEDTPSGVTASDITDRGAAVPFVELEAERAVTNGSVIGPDSSYATLPAEASGRQAVTLDAVGEYVEFTLTEPASAVTVRHSVPDNAQGTGITAPVDVIADGRELAELSFTSKYGWYYGSFPWTNTPGDNPHHFYDEARTLFGTTLPAGAKVRIQVSSTSEASSFTVDLADFEQVPDPIARPDGSLSVVDFGADPAGGSDATAAFQAAVDAGARQGAEVWIPQGEYLLYDHVIVDKVTLRGAGPWYSVLGGRHPDDRSKAVGIYGEYAADGAASTDVSLRDFAIIGEITERVDNDQVNAIGGSMTDSTVDNVWLQRTKVGAWMDGPMDNFSITGSRILNQTADGVNFHKGVTNSRVENTFVRNTGDDGLAMWAESQPNRANSFTDNTVVAPILANNIAVYGGEDITVSGNVVAESVMNGGGIHVGNRFPGVDPGNGTDVRGTFTIAGNTVIRGGNADNGWPFPVGAIWFDARNSPIDKATIKVTGTDIIDSTYAAIHFVSGQVSGVEFSDVDIDGTGTFALQFNDPASASFTNVTATGVGFAEPIYACLEPGITQGEGNSGWNEQLPKTYCGEWPDPV